MANPVLDDILARLRATQREFDQEFDRLLAEGRQQFQYTLRRGKVVFERGVRRLYLRQRTAVWRYVKDAPLAFILTAPVIYGMILPFTILDLSITLYQHVCFRVYRIPLVRRADYLVTDRHRLPYLNAIEKLNCVYCGYGNQVLEYAREVAARTEQYWCPIKHGAIVKSGVCQVNGRRIRRRPVAPPVGCRSRSPGFRLHSECPPVVP